MVFKCVTNFASSSNTFPNALAISARKTSTTASNSRGSNASAAANLRIRAVVVFAYASASNRPEALSPFVGCVKILTPRPMNEIASAVSSSTAGGNRSNATRWLLCQTPLPSASSLLSPSATDFTKNSSHGSTIVPYAHHPNICCIITCVTFQYTRSNASRASGCPARNQASRAARITSLPITFSSSKTPSKLSHNALNTTSSPWSALSIVLTMEDALAPRNASCSSFKIFPSYALNSSFNALASARR
mmetsp:Transcript_4319/g.15814  ORF Transcript_4319/g.15814 Transcript_4319/m.15814 type:complete len:248 (-) Transcript_4319:266-1009(-)